MHMVGNNCQGIGNFLGFYCLGLGRALHHGLFLWHLTEFVYEAFIARKLRNALRTKIEVPRGVESVPAMLQRNYALMRDLDKSLQGVRKQNEQRCEQEIEDIKRGIESGTIKADASLIRFSDDALEEQKHCIRIADEKVALATQAYDMVDAHIQQLDQYMRRIEELRQERELATGADNAAGVSNTETNTRSARAAEGGRGGRKKSRLAAEPPAIELELPVDPNEPTYCICNQVSFGKMVACDNSSCKIEWFHFDCVGLKEQPKGKWYCPSCSGQQKRRKGK